MIWEKTVPYQELVRQDGHGESFLQEVLDGLPEAVMVVDDEYRVILMNCVAREFASTAEDGCQPQHCYQMLHQSHTPCAGDKTPCPLSLVKTANKPVTVVHEHYQADGQKRLIEVNAAPLNRGGGSFLGIIESMRDITDQRRVEEERHRFSERHRALAARLAEVTEAERQRLSRELHDQVGQNLTALGINLNIIRSELLETASPSLQIRLEDTLALVMNTTECIRNVMAELRPPVLDDYGLVAALDWYGRRFRQRTNIAMTIEGKEPAPRLAPRVENALFRIAQEAFCNIAKHAHATQVNIMVNANHDRVRLTIEDDGIGFDLDRVASDSQPPCWGLLTMTERADAVGGHCLIESQSGRGTQVVVEVQR